MSPLLRTRSLVDLLAQRSTERPEGAAYLFLANGEEESEELSFAALDAKARAIGAAVARRAAPGERALLLFAPGLDFIAAFFGCLAAGVVAVPAYPPQRRRLETVAAIAADARPAVVLSDGALADRYSAGGDALPPSLAGVPWIAADRVPRDAADGWSAPDVDGDAVAFLQYTSGSTSTPKGVVVRHRNLLHNEEMIRRAFAQSAESVVVSWLPLYHDMGLIGGVLQPLYCGGRCVLMAPLAFLQRPRRWLEAVSRYRATTSGGPNFAYDLCVDRVPEEERAGLDLSSWQVAFNGSEPVRPETLERFSAAFAGTGFRRRAFYPCYGLAEGTLFVSGGAADREPSVRAFAADELRSGRARQVDEVAAPASTSRRRLVGCGNAWMEQRLVVADPETGRRLADGEIGEIWVHGPSVADGYWRRPGSDDVFAARLAGEPDSLAFLRTGDLGFLADGELFVAGRLKDLVILRGRNYHPHDLELTTERAHPDLRPAGAAAFPVAVDGEEKLVLVAEVSRHSKAGVEEVAAAVRAAVAEVHAAAVYEVVLILARTLPKTSSGKVRRRACRQAYLDGALREVGRHRFGAADPAPPEADEAPAGEADDLSLAAELSRLDAGERRRRVAAVLRRQAAALAGLPESALRDGGSLVSLGLDSLAAVELSHRLERALGVPVAGVELLEDDDLDGLARRLADRFAATPAAAAEDADAPLNAGGQLPPGPHPQSQGQRALWFLHRLAPESSAYHVTAAFRVVGDGGEALDEEALVRALERMVERHPMLRATFHESATEPAGAAADDLGGPVFRIAATPRVDVRREDVAGLDDVALARRAADLAAQPFDLEAGPPLRLALLRRGGERVVVLGVHHLVSDFWSMALLARELGVLYRAQRVGGVAEPPRPGATFLDHVRAEQRRLAGAEGERLWDYWRTRLTPLPPRLELPTDRPRPARRRWVGAEATGRTGAAVAQEVRALARRRGATPFHVALAAFYVLLSRHSGQRDLVVGAPVAGRTEPGSAGVVGYFVNPLPLRIDLGDAPAFAELVDRVRGECLQAIAHQGLPLVRVTEGLRLPRDESSTPLFQALCVEYRGLLPGEQPLAALALGCPGVRADLGGLDVESFPLPVTGAQFDLSLAFAEVEDELVLSLRYDADLFDAVTAERLVDGFVRLLAAGLESPGERVSRLPLLSAEERRQVVVEWNGTAREWETDGEALLHRLVAAQAARTPEAPALRFTAREGDGRGDVNGAEELTYGELWCRVRRLAGALVTLGVGAESRVGLVVERSPQMVVGLLAVLEAGGAYVPVSPENPPPRLRWLLADALGDGAGDAAPVVLAPSSSCELAAQVSPPGTRVVDLEAPESWPEAAAEWRPSPADAAAYVIYTSGSTGRPKGVVNGHRGVVNRLQWMRRTFPQGPGGRVLQKTPLTFDVSIWEVFWPLSTGACLVLARPGGHRDPAYLVRTVRDEGLTELHFVPSMLGAFLEEPDLESCTTVRRVFASGEALTPELVKRFHQRLGALSPVGAELHNLYGPTEASIEVSWWPCAETAPATVPIGHPIDNLRLHVLDGALEPVPPGVAGELYLAGWGADTGLARGYQGRPGRTAGAFVPDPFAAELGQAAGVELTGGRLYRSGDLARQRPDGAVEYLGRVDRQVKLRGFRIELGEIETALTGHPTVREAAVGLVGEGVGSRLAAWVVPAEAEAVDAAALTRHLETRLPSYMVPSAFVELGSLPLTASGKLDRRALPDPEAPAGGAGEPPRGETETALAALWAELLGRDGVGRDDHFFDLGGHSLLAVRLLARVREALGVELALRDVFAAPTLAALARRLDAAARDAGTAERLPPLTAVQSPPRERELSFAQERMWFLDRLEGGSAAYHMPALLRLVGELSRPALSRAAAAIVARHQVLRSVYELDGERPVQVVQAPPRGGLPEVDLTALPAARRRVESERLRRAALLRRFDLAVELPFRFHLERLGAEEWMLVAVFHHVAFDGASVGVVVEELGVLYTAFVEGRPSPLSTPPVQYADFAAWQRRLPEELWQRDLAFWRRELEGLPPALELPTDRPHAEDRPRRAGRTERRLEAATVAALARRCRELGATPFQVWAAAYAVLLGRWSGSRDLAMGVPEAGRDRRQLEWAVGLYVNTLVVRVGFADDPSFGGLVERVRGTLLEAQQHAALPFGRLVEELSPRRELGRTPLVQVLLVADETPLVQAGLRLPGLRIEVLPPPALRAKLDLTASVAGTASGETQVLSLEYDADLFDAATADRLADGLLRLLAAGVEEPGERVSRLPLLSAAERRQVVAGWNETAREWDTEGEPLLHRLVAAQAARTPEAPALRFAAEELTYGELWSRVRRLASALVSLGVGPEVRVGVFAERSTELVVGLHAVLEAGGAYVPLDPEYPAERLAFMLRDGLAGAGSPPPVVLTQRQLAGRAAELAPEDSRLLLLDAEASWPAGPTSWPAPHPDGAAYVIYTSGSTGRPKGVVNRHRAIVNRLLWMQRAFPLAGDDRVLQKTPSSFDVSVWEFFWPLLAGACLVVARPGGHRDAAYLVRTLASERVTTLHFVPSMLAAFLEEPEVESCTALRRVIASGEALTPEMVRRFHRRLGAASPVGAELHNLYGPTEAAVDVSWWPCREEEPAAVPIGHPIDNLRLHVLDGALEPVPPGVTGELYLGGYHRDGGLARCYHARPALTAERFVPDPFAAELGSVAEPGTALDLGLTGGRLYRTGDLARQRRAGAVEYLGRADGQVKLRGFRIELGEIEAALRTHPAVREAAAGVVGEGVASRLVAWVVPAEGATMDAAGLARYLESRLPSYMVPSAFVELASMPLTASGKLDRRALPAPDAPAAGAGEPPRGETEMALAALWRELLGCDAVGRDDHFFDLGGHSLLAVRLLARVREGLGVELALRDVFAAPTLAALAQRLDAAVARRPAAAADALPRLVPRRRLESVDEDALPLSFAQEGLWFLERLNPGSPAYNGPQMVEVDGDLEVSVLRRAVDEIVRRHESLRTVFPEVDGRPVQRVLAPAPVPLPLVDLSALPAARAETEARRRIGAEMWRPFDVAAGPLLRLAVWRLGAGRHLLLVNLHHMVSDAWSGALVVAEVGELYPAFAAGRPSPLPELPVQYADFALWQRRWLRGERRERLLDYWRRRLGGELEPQRLPTDRPEPPHPSPRGGRLAAGVDAELTARLRRLAADEGASLFMLLLAALAAVLSRHTGQHDQVLGTDMVSREHPDAERLIGFFINMLALRLDLSGNPSFRDLLRQAREVSLGAFAHRELPFDMVVEEVRPQRRVSHSPLFRVVLVLDNTPGRRLELPSLTLTPQPVEDAAAVFDVTVWLRDDGGALEGWWGFRGDLFDRSTIAALHDDLVRVLRRVADDPDVPLDALPVSAGAARRDERQAANLGRLKSIRRRRQGEGR